jgi:hypothetical protein
MIDEDRSTLAGLREVARARAERIPGWQVPIAYAVGCRRDGGWHCPHVNQPGGTHGLPAVILAECLGYTSGTREFSLTPAQLDDTIAAVFIGPVDDDPAGPTDAALRSRLTGG